MQAPDKVLHIQWHIIITKARVTRQSMQWTPGYTF